jgi:hypothetical protein
VAQGSRIISGTVAINASVPMTRTMPRPITAASETVAMIALAPTMCTMPLTTNQEWPCVRSVRGSLPLQLPR